MTTEQPGSITSLSPPPACPTWCAGHPDADQPDGWEYVHPRGPLVEVAMVCHSTPLPWEGSGQYRIFDVGMTRGADCVNGTDLEVGAAEVDLGGTSVTPQHARNLAAALVLAADTAEGVHGSLSGPAPAELHGASHDSDDPYGSHWSKRITLQSSDRPRPGPV